MARRVVLYKHHYEVAQFYKDNGSELSVKGWPEKGRCNQPGAFALPADSGDIKTNNENEQKFLGKNCGKCPQAIAQACFMDAIQDPASIDGGAPRGNQTSQEVSKYALAYSQIGGNPNDNG